MSQNITNQSEIKKFILINLVSPRISREAGDKALGELQSLVTTYGGATIVKVIQRRDFPDNDTYIGKGKTEELKEIAAEEKADVVVINDIVKPGQMYNLRSAISSLHKQVEVWDRIDLILHIFAKHAQTAEAKLQIELASMRHMGPRIYGMGMVLSRQGGGIGGRGIGETNTELMKRHWRDAMKKDQDKLEKLMAERQKQLDRRKSQGLKTVSIIGYTNAGKSSLFNLLSKKHKLVENALFATLDSAVGQLYLPQSYQSVLISDTIGFIQNLPPQLVDAFKSTLLESINADLLLHVIDVSDPHMKEKIQIVEEILADLGVDSKPKIYVFNKIDQTPQLNTDELITHYAAYSPHFISTYTKQGIEALVQQIDTFFYPQSSSEQSLTTAQTI